MKMKVTLFVIFVEAYILAEFWNQIVNGWLLLRVIIINIRSLTSDQNPSAIVRIDS